MARVARIWPLHLVAMLAAVPLSLWVQHDGFTGAQLAAGALTQALLLNSWIPIGGIREMYNTPSWTLGVEVVGYALVPLLIWATTGILRLRMRGLVVFALTIWAVESFLSIALNSFPTIHPGVGSFVPLRVSEIFVGALVGLGMRAWLDGSATRRSKQAFSRATWTLLEVGSLGLCLLSMRWAPDLPVGLTTGAWFVPAWVAVILVFASGKGVLARALHWRGAVAAGEISFAIYLFHLTIYRYLQAVPYLQHQAPWITGAVALVSSLAVAALAWRHVEVPARRAIRRRGDALVEHTID